MYELKAYITRLAEIKFTFSSKVNSCIKTDNKKLLFYNNLE